MVDWITAEMFFSTILPFGVSFAYIWLKAFQQLNVMHGKVLWVVPVSLFMGLCEVTVVSLVVKQSFWVFLPIGLGGGLGCILAMFNHQKLREKYNNKE